MKNQVGKILIAGASGYLGGHVLTELNRRGLPVVAIARHTKQAEQLSQNCKDVKIAQVTDPASLIGIFDGVETIFSSIGITRQKEGLSYRDVDFQGNLNLLRAAYKAGVKKFVYVSVIHGPKLRHVPIIDAKEAFVDELIAENIESCIIRPTGFFSDMKDLFQMAKQGRVYLFGNGESKINPISGEDLAAVCVESIVGKAQEVIVGGPEVFSQNEIAQLAFKSLNKSPQITHIPVPIVSMGLRVAKLFFKQTDYGALEMYLTMSSVSTSAPKFGDYKLSDFFDKISSDT